MLHKSFLTVPVMALLIAGLTIAGHAQDNSALKDTLMQTDTRFAKDCEANGMYHAFTSYASPDDVIEMGEGSLPVIGVDSFKVHWAKRKDRKTPLRWHPVKADVSGNLGYTFGYWSNEGKTEAQKDTTYYGVYVTVWKKQKDGSWKYVLDGGNDTPKPVK